MLLRRDCITHLCPDNTASHGHQLAASSDEPLETILRKTTTVGSTLFNLKYTSQRQPSPLPHFRVYPAAEAALPSIITPAAVPSRRAAMDGKRHASSFQQLEKLGEGTYATVSAQDGLCNLTCWF